MSRTANAESVRWAHNRLDDYLDRQALLAARECGRFDQSALASAFGWHRSNGSRAMNGSPDGGRWFAHIFGGLYRLATYPNTDAWPVIARGQIVVRRSEIKEASVHVLRRDFWQHMDARREAEREATAAMEAHDGRRFADAEARRASEASAVSAHMEELLSRGVDPLEEGRAK